MQTTAIRNFKTHPAQMRTTHDIGKLAELTLQIYERGPAIRNMTQSGSSSSWTNINLSTDLQSENIK